MNAIQMIREKVKVVLGFKTVNIEIHADNDDETAMINTILTGRLTYLKLDEVIKTMVVKKDVIILVPHNSITVQELYVEVNRLFGGSVKVGTAL